MTLENQMKIDLTGAIEKREREIFLLCCLRQKMELLIDESRKVDSGLRSAMSETEWLQLKNKIELEMFQLGLAHWDDTPNLGGPVGIPRLWSHVELI